MKKLEQKLSKILFLVVSLVSLFCTVTSCNSWMEDDGFFEDIEGEVKYANAPEISVFVRYAAPKMGTTDPNGNITFKVGITKEVTATTESSYGFWKWAAFSTEYLSKEYHQDFCFVDEESYEADILPHELGDEIVHFSDRTSPSTQITINEKRDDIFIIPVVANRPAANTSLPGPGQSNVIKNSAIRIFFSKSMDLDSFKNEEGVYDTIQVLQSSQNITSDGSLAVVSEDISDRFEDPSFSTDGKTLTLKFTSAALTEGFTSGSYVSVIVSHEVKDVYGYEMTDDFKLSFQVGSKFDTLAPRITALTAGIAQQYNTFGSMYKDAGTVTNMGSYTQITNTAGASAANGNIDNSLYTENILAQRVNNRLNIRVYAEDISGSGSDQNPLGVENDVSAIGILANSLVLMDGTASPNDEEHKIPFKSIAYVPQKNDTDIPGTYKSITGTTNGCLFTYDLSSLPDGLIEIRVWAYDSVGNAGNSEGGYYSSEYGNGYASIFVVKDTTAPDAISNLSNIDSSSVQAPYHWYNAASLSSMQIYEKSAGAVIDSGHQKLRSKSENLKWMFKVTDGTSWGSEVTPATDGWVNTSAGYSISNASIPSQDGAIALSMILMDDIGNISEVAPISSIVYDNTAPVVSDMSWVTPDGIIARNTTSTQVIDGTSTLLKVPFTEVSSGIRRIKVTIKNSNNENYATPLAASSFKVRYAADSSVLPGNATELQIIPETGTTTDNLFVLAEPETAPITSGILYISDLKIDSPDGVYSIVVELYDASLNVSASKTITIANDTTAPVINSVVINDVVSSTSYDGVTKTWLPASNYVDGNPSAVKLTINTTEMGSGIEIIKLGNKASITAQTRIEGLEIGTDYVIEGDTIRLLDTYNPKIIGANKVIVLTNVILLEPNGNNPVDVRLIDFAYKSVDSANAASVYADNTPPVITNNVILSDISGDSQNVFTSDSSNYSPLMYTNNNTVNINIPLGTAETIGAGVKSINISNATVSLPAFAIYVNDTTELVKGADYTISGSDTVIFAKPFTNEVVVNFKNIQFTDSLNQIHTVSVKATDLTGWESTVITSSQIWLDTIAPVFSEEMYFTADGSSTVGAINSSILANQILHLKFTEVTSGLKSIRIHVTKDGTTSTTLPFNNPSLQVMIDGSVVPYTVNGEVLTFETPAKTGELTIKGLRISDTESIDTDGTFTIKASLLDASQNSNAEADKSISIVKDTIAPAVGAVSVDGAVNDWVKNDTVTIRFTVTENGTGVSYISLGNNAQITSLSTLVIDGVPETATADVTNNRMVLPNARTLSNAVIQITNVSLTEALDAPNTIRVTVYDNVTNNQYNEKTDIKKDGTAPSITSVTIKDASSGSSDYTNNHLITMEVSIPAGETSGLKSLTITGAEFTSSTAVTGTTLTPTFDGLTVTFGTSSGTTAQVIEGSSAVTLTFTNVSIPEGDASKLVSVVATDLVGNTTVTAVSSNAIILDETKPVSNSENITWIPPAGSVAGVFRGTVMDEILQVPFTDAPAGIVKIQMDITNVNATYPTPFANSDFALTYIDASGTEQALAKDTDYTVSGNIITLNAPYTTGTFTFKNLKVSDTEVEGEYTFAVIFTDAAENVMDSSASKTANNDSTAPEVSKLYVPGIVCAKNNDYYISNEYASKSTTNNKSVIIKLTVKENNSGISKIVFDTNDTLKFNNVAVKLNNELVNCTSDENTKTITISTENPINKNGTNESVTIEIEGVCIFSSYSLVSKNNCNINLKVYDVAGNVSTSYGTVESDGDGIPITNATSINFINNSPSINTVKLTDRNSDVYKPQDGFTNEQYVNLEIKLNVGNNDCPVYKITLDGATFDKNNSISVNNASNVIASENIVISDDGKSLSIKYGAGYAEMANGSGTNKDTITINNVKLDSATEGTHTVKVKVTNACQFTANKEYTIILDTTKPEWNTTNPLYSYNMTGTGYEQYANKIYPTPQASSKAYAPIVGSDQYFYTAFKDGSDTTESCYVSGDCTESNLLGFTTSGTNLSSGNSFIKLTSGVSSYTIVAVDKAGNVSEPIVCNVRAENSKNSIPSVNLHKYITLVQPVSGEVFIRSNKDEIANSSNFSFYDDDSTHTASLKANKTVIKKASVSEPYKIVVKLGEGIATSDKTLDGKNVKSSNTIGAYANLGPTSSYSPVTHYSISHWYGDWPIDFSGAQPDFTYQPAFPNDGNYSSSQLRSYFGFSDNEHSTWLTSNCSWHSYVKGSNRVNEAGVTSYVDNNNNLVIELPTSGVLPPLTLLLKNGTGQLNYVNLSVPESGYDPLYSHTSWEVDDKLGGAEVGADGSTGTRSIGMNPISSQSTNGNTEQWGNVTYSWGNQASTTSWITPYDGDSITGRAVKNKVNQTTYYTNDVKMGLFISSDPDHNDVIDAPESITFTVTGKRSDPATAEQVAAGEYTARAKLYCTKSSTAPTYSTIVNTSESNGQVTPWCYVRTKAEVDTIFFMDYPHPNYTALNWSPKEPYYIYYVVEDRVGNYEIETVVNSRSNTDMVKWLYDAEGPKVTVGDTGLPPDDSSISINQLIPNTNGYQAYEYSTSGSTRNVAIGFNKTARPGATINETQREGTTRWVAGETSRYNCSFFDIKVTDNNGIRAFAYSLTSDVPAFTFGNAQQDEGKWFAGSSGSDSGFGKDTEIGATANATEYVTYNKYDAGSDYNGKYSGTPVCSVFPNDYDNTPIYLHVMDWVGNVSSYRMGNNVTWKKDTTKPEAGNGTTEKLGANYIASKTDGIIISEKDSNASVKLEIPTDWYSEGTTSIYGYSFTQNDVSTVKRDGTIPYLEIPYSTFSNWPASGTNQIEFWVYDCVGNCNPSRLNALYDITAPTLEVTISAGDDKLLYQPDWNSTNTDSQSSNAVNLSSYHDYFIYCSNPANDNPNNKLFTTESEIADHATTVFTNNASVTVQLGTLDADGKQRFIQKWTDSSWENVSCTWSDGSNGTINRTGKWNGSSFTWDGTQTSQKTNLSLSTTPTYYCFSLVDKSGNTSYAYFKLASDTTGPEITISGYEKVNTVDSKNYYSSKSKVNYNVTDSSGVLNDGFNTYSEYKESVDVNEFLSGISLESNKLKITAKDNLKNSKDIQLSYNNISSWVYDNSIPSCGSISSAKQYLKNNNYGGADRNINGVSVTRNPGAQFSSILISQTDASRTSRINASGVSSFTISNVSTFVGSSDAKGWKVVIGNSSTAPTKPDFVNWNDVDVGKNGTSYTFSTFTDKTYYFYPINYAGTVGDPIKFTFETPIVPEISLGELTGMYYNNSPAFLGTTNGTAAYIGTSNSKFKVNVKNPSNTTGIKIKGYYLYIKSFNSSDYRSLEMCDDLDITIASKGNETIEISFELRDEYGVERDYLFGELCVQILTENTVTELKSLGYFMKNNVINDSISIDTAKFNNTDSGYGYFSYSYGYHNIYYGNNTDTIELNFKCDERIPCPVVGYSLDQSTWTDTNTITINRGTGFESIYTVYAKDMIGNIGSIDLKFFEDAENPVISSLTSSTANTVYDSTNNKFYSKESSIEVKVNTSDTDISYFTNGSTQNQDGIFTLSSSGEYTFYAVDKVGNESSPYTITLIKDSLPPPTPSGTLTFYNGETQVTTGYIFDNVNNTVRFNPNKVTKVVFTPSAQTDDAATAVDGLGSGIKGYSGSRTATEWTATVTSALSSTDSGKEYKFYSCDKVGNVCESSLKYTFTADSTGPQPSGTIKNEPPYGSFKTSDTPTIKGIYVSMTDVPATIAYDDIVGNNYATLIYNAGTTFNVELTDSDCVEYAFTCGCDSSATTQPTSFTSITPVGTTITVPMPESKLPHYYIFLWLKDSVGNVSVYNLIQDKDGEKNWWLSEDTTPNITYSYNSINGNLTISGLTCIPLKNVSISGNNINISTYSITFDYNIPTNYLSTKSYAKNISWSNNFGTLSDSPQLTGSGTIVINIGNAASDIAVTINSENGSGGVIAIPNAASPINQFASAIVSTVRTIFTPKTKKIRLTSEVETKVVEKETGVISQNNQSVLTDNSSSNKNRTSKVRKATPDKVKLNSKVAKNTVTQKKNTVIPEGAKVLEVTSIENMTNLSVASTEIIETSGVETTVVKNDSEVSNKDNSKLVYGIIAIVMCAVIAMVVIVNKVLVDKTK